MTPTPGSQDLSGHGISLMNVALLAGARGKPHWRHRTNSNEVPPQCPADYPHANKGPLCDCPSHRCLTLPSARHASLRLVPQPSSITRRCLGCSSRTWSVRSSLPLDRPAQWPCLASALSPSRSTRTWAGTCCCSWRACWACCSCRWPRARGRPPPSSSKLRWRWAAGVGWFVGNVLTGRESVGGLWEMCSRAENWSGAHPYIASCSACQGNVGVPVVRAVA
jgi:hypothetical protein